jgi:hypothetical protein
VVDHVDPSVLAEEAVPGLAVGVVDDEVEHRDPTELLGEPLGEREVVLLGVRRDEQLDGSDAERTVAEDGRRHVRPSERARDEVGGDLPGAQRALGEVPERGLAATRLVDGERLLTRIGPGADQERVVRRVGEAPEQLEVADGDGGRDVRLRQRRLACPFIAGQT